MIKHKKKICIISISNNSSEIKTEFILEGSNWLLTPYKIKNKETILIACDYKGGDQTECIGYKSNLSIILQKCSN
jgi:hypothetical protein